MALAKGALPHLPLPSPRASQDCGPEQMTSPAGRLTAALPLPVPDTQEIRRKGQTLDGGTPGGSRGPRQGNQGSQVHTYGLGGREVRETLLWGRGMLAGLPVGQRALLLGRCRQQAEAPVRGASLQPPHRPSLPRNAGSHVPPGAIWAGVNYPGAGATAVFPPGIGHGGEPRQMPQEELV